MCCPKFLEFHPDLATIPKGSTILKTKDYYFMMPKNGFGKWTSQSTISKLIRSINVGQFEVYSVSYTGLTKRFGLFSLKILIKHISILILTIYRVYWCCSATFKYLFSELNLRANFNKLPIFTNYQRLHAQI